MRKIVKMMINGSSETEIIDYLKKNDLATRLKNLLSVLDSEVELNDPSAKKIMRSFYKELVALQLSNKPGKKDFDVVQDSLKLLKTKPNEFLKAIDEYEKDLEKKNEQIKEPKEKGMSKEELKSFLLTEIKANSFSLKHHLKMVKQITGEVTEDDIKYVMNLFERVISFSIKNERRVLS